MQTKQNFNRFKFFSATLSSVVLTTGLFAVSSNNDGTLQEKLDKKYITNASCKMLFSKPLGGLTNKEQDTFMLGKSFFRIPWVEAPAATTARDGLGPLFNSNTCVHCHPHNGQARMKNENGDIARGYVTRLSIPSNNSYEHKELIKYAGFVPEPMYGAQISVNGSKDVPFEAKPIVQYQNKYITYKDGQTVVLSKPVHGINTQLEELGYGDMHKEISITNRMGQALVGLGLLDALTDEQILVNQDIEDKNGDGISGKANIVYSPKHKDFRVGRFTWKASAPSVLHQSAGAASNDMSLTTSLFPKENCTKFQVECLKAPRGDVNRQGGEEFDLTDQRLEAIAFYLTSLKVPKSTITQKDGEKLFDEIGCIKCHIPSFTLENGYKFKPFTDMLLHDMGEDLSDGRTEFLASPNEWRTAPLWNVGKYKIALQEEPNLLHDGRAKTIEEAILWHGGEAQKTKEQFMNLNEQQREQLIKYVEEL